MSSSSLNSVKLTPEQEALRRQELERRLESLDEVILVHAIERSAELRNDPRVDQSKIQDVIRVEMEVLRSQRDRLVNELCLQQEIGIER